MLATSVLFLALAATGLADIPAGYRAVYMTSNVNKTFVIEAKTATAGAAIVV